MGLTGAGSHFQHCLVTEVLTDLLSSTCELYLDDCIVHAKSVDEYIGNLREVFSRFRNSGLTLNPSKCQLGLTQVEYVGHTIDSDGTHFTMTQASLRQTSMRKYMKINEEQNDKEMI